MTGESAAFDSILEQSRDQHRRIVLGALAERQQSMTLDDLTEVVVKHNHQTTTTEVAEDVLKEVRLSLYHVHLPKLDSGGLVHFDPERHRVEPTEELERVQSALSTILDADPSLDPPIAL